MPRPANPPATVHAGKRSNAPRIIAGGKSGKGWACRKSLKSISPAVATLDMPPANEPASVACSSAELSFDQVRLIIIVAEIESAAASSAAPVASRSSTPDQSRMTTPVAIRALRHNFLEPLPVIMSCSGFNGSAEVLQGHCNEGIKGFVLNGVPTIEERQAALLNTLYKALAVLRRV